MSKRTTFAAIVAAAALLLVTAPAAQARISPHDYDSFMSGVAAHAYQMDGAEQQFTQMANSLRTSANEIGPLVGKQDSLSQQALQAQLSVVNSAITTIDATTSINQKLFDKACDRFLKQYVKAWSTKKEKDRVKKGVEDMRDAFHQFWQKNYADLRAAAVTLSNQDVPGFWQQLAIAEGGVAFTVHAFDKANRNLLRM
jgi:hypothetical protein